MQLERQGKKPCRFYLPAGGLTPSSTPSLEPKHWFLRQLQAAYERSRRAIETADGGLLGQLKRIIGFLESKIDAEEALMKQLRKADVVEVIYPPHLNQKWVRRMFRRFIRRHLHHHERWLAINFFLLPVTGVMLLLPGPNVFFGWNAFRLISHYLAREGGRRVRQGRCQILFIPDEGLLSATDEQKVFA